MIINLGIILPVNLVADNTNTTQSSETIEQVVTMFKGYYSKNNFYNTPELAWEDFQSIYGKSTLNLDDILSKTDISDKINTKLPHAKKLCE